MNQTTSSKSLVLFYSWGGSTRRVAQGIAQKTASDLLELKPAVPYPGDYNTVVAQAKQEIQRRYEPPLAPVAVDWNAYDTVYLGTPNWWSTMAPPLYSFLRELMPTEKTIIPFCTHGGGGAGHIARDIANLCIGCDVLPIFSVQGDGGADLGRKLEDWLKRIGQL